MALKLDDIWPDLQKVLQQFLTDLTGSSMNLRAWLSTFSKVQKYCLQGKSEEDKQIEKELQEQNAQRAQENSNLGGGDVYRRLKRFLEQHVQGIQTRGKGNVGEGLLLYYKREWDYYTSAIHKIAHIFKYLERFYIPNNKLFYIIPLCLNVWKEGFFNDNKKGLVGALLTQIKCERDGTLINTLLMKTILHSLVPLGLTFERQFESTLGLYQEGFEQHLLEETETYYVVESVTFIENNDVCEYMKKVETRLAEELHRAETYLHPTSTEPLLRTCHNVLIGKHLARLQEEFPRLIANNKIEDLTRLYSLLSKLGDAGLDMIRRRFERFVRASGDATIKKIAAASLSNNSEGPKIFVEAVLGVCDRFEDMVTTIFKNDSGMRSSLDRACRRFINTNELTKLSKQSPKPSEYLAKYAHKLLSKNSGHDTSQIENKLDSLLLVFKYIEEKDIFMSYYQKSLSTRLLNKTSYSEEMEKVMLEKLKRACGFAYTAKLVRMFTDMTISQELNGSFQESSEFEEINSKTKIEFFNFVLDVSAWPLEAQTNSFQLPSELELCKTQFEKFYRNKHRNRLLTQLEQYSKAEVKSNLWKGKPYQFSCSTYQAFILSMFNKATVLSYNSIKAASNLQDKKGEYLLSDALRAMVLKRVIRSDPNILEKDPKTNKVLCHEASAFKGKEVRFKLNPKFTSSSLKVSLVIPHLPKPPERVVNDKSENGIPPEVIKEREMKCQIAIVRMMKTHNVLTHNRLVELVVAQVSSRFKPDLRMIKKCIGFLITKEFLKRTGDNDSYEYLA